MNDNDKFITRWRPIHENTMSKYVIRYSLIYTSIMALIAIIFIWIYPSISINNRNQPIGEDNIILVISVFALATILNTVSRLINWFSGEKRYKKIINKVFS